MVTWVNKHTAVFFLSHVWSMSRFIFPWLDDSSTNLIGTPWLLSLLSSNYDTQGMHLHVPLSREYFWSTLCFLSLFLTSIVWGGLSRGHCYGWRWGSELSWGWGKQLAVPCWWFEGTQASRHLALCPPTPQAPYLLRGDRWAQEPLSFTHPQYGSLEAIQVLQEKDDCQLPRIAF